ncbi:hypothetical protein [Caballeronia sp. LZ035]|uniref:hypothetical protein n=1 Tax=Caballeronia sp. LZ035 TaxID=3038568 RepID=UPI00286679E8|nr:hypothetical protein [Caballeronia sp. LZ035]MDR5758204.1 hypothetical protein [Caballeronia sp. LZ035]
MAKLKAGKDAAFRAEIELFYMAMKAKALLKAIAWANDSPGDLAVAIGMERPAGYNWVKRGYIPVRAALLLERVAGFPLEARDMRPDADLAAYKARRCPHCDRNIYPPSMRSGCPSPHNYGRHVPRTVKPSTRVASPKNGERKATP